jgi:hypothetical protein
MNARGRSPFVLAAGVALLSQFVVPVTVSGQAWVPPRRTGIVSLAFRNVFVHDHTDDTGKRFDMGHISQDTMSTELDFGLSRRLAVNFGLPLIYGKYTGPVPHVDPGQVKYIDDGHYNGGFQDFRVGLRYNLVRDRPFVVTPFVEGIVPSHNYDTYGHALRGRNLRELLVGTNVGRDLEPWLPRAYFQVRVAHAFVEDVEDSSHHHELGTSHNRTNIDGEVWLRVTARVGISGAVHFQKHHGGLIWINCGRPLRQCYTDEEWHVHSQLFRTDALDVGGGLSYLLTSATSVFASFLNTPWSRNAHAISRGITVGMNWRFDTRPRRVLPPEQPKPVETASYGFR